MAMTRSPGRATSRKKVAGDATASGSWRRGEDARDVTSKLGQRIRTYREKLGLSLSEASEATGLPAATLSRIENNKMSPTFSVLLKLTRGLQLPWGDLVGPSSTAPTDQRISFSYPEDRSTTHILAHEYASLHADISLSRRLTPLIFEVSTQRLEDVGGLSGHKGTEFCYVLRGTLLLHFEGREPQELPVGSSVLFKGEIPHAYVAKDRSGVQLLNVIAHEPIVTYENLPPFAERLPGLTAKVEKNPRPRGTAR